MIEVQNDIIRFSMPYGGGTMQVATIEHNIWMRVTTPPSGMFRLMLHNRSSCEIRLADLQSSVLPVTAKPTLRDIISVSLLVRIVKLRQNERTYEKCRRLPKLDHVTRKGGGPDLVACARIILEDAIARKEVRYGCAEQDVMKTVLDIGTDTVDMKSVFIYPEARRVPGSITFPTIVAYNAAVGDEEYW